MPIIDLVFGKDKFTVPSEKDAIRDKLARDVQAFVDGGGKIKQIPITFRDYVPRFVVTKNG